MAWIHLPLGIAEAMSCPPRDAGRLRVAAEATASATSHDTNKPVCRRTNGPSARRLPSFGLVPPGCR